MFTRKKARRQSNGGKMISEVLTVAGETVVLAGQCVSLLRVKKGIPEGSGREAADQAGRILARCRDAMECGDSHRAKEMIEESAVDLLNAISGVPPALAFFVLDYFTACAAAVKDQSGLPREHPADPAGTAQGPVPRHRRP